MRRGEEREDIPLLLPLLEPPPEEEDEDDRDADTVTVRNVVSSPVKVTDTIDVAVPAPVVSSVHVVDSDDGAVAVAEDDATVDWVGVAGPDVLSDSSQVVEDDCDESSDEPFDEADEDEDVAAGAVSVSSSQVVVVPSVDVPAAAVVVSGACVLVPPGISSVHVVSGSALAEVLLLPVWDGVGAEEDEVSSVHVVEVDPLLLPSLPLVLLLPPSPSPPPPGGVTDGAVVASTELVDQPPVPDAPPPPPVPVPVPVPVTVAVVFPVGNGAEEVRLPDSGMLMELDPDAVPEADPEADPEPVPRGAVPSAPVPVGPPLPKVELGSGNGTDPVLLDELGHGVNTTEVPPVPVPVGPEAAVEFDSGNGTLLVGLILGAVPVPVPQGKGSVPPVPVPVPVGPTVDVRLVKGNGGDEEELLPPVLRGIDEMVPTPVPVPNPVPVPVPTAELVALGKG